ncbi:hypothetical protein BT96DRAFT_982934 [Gymnopus androsaceus JB14]|uniref:Uncharacterized protein n=1 Tax=Gymnopus androsaceus JB14 TaxID=1447944 RepID=A0A6A4IL42_9AGAR|nr:hypothetical protein BT96DRAFT_982934 [Gymnopus androsaceus JB14]
MLSATTSPAPTPLTVSTPSSPKVSSHSKVSKDLELVCHIIPPRVHKHRVTGLELLHNDELTAVLQDSGDGKCFASIQIAETNLASSDGVKHSPSIHDVWLWTQLRSYAYGEPPPQLPAESVSLSFDPDDSPKDSCRVVLLELRTSHLIGTLEVKLEPIENQSFVFHSLNVDGKFAVQQLHILSHAPVLPTAIKEPQESQLNLGALGPLPNPFKSKPKSVDENAAAEPSRSSRVRLDDVSVTGTLTVSQGPLLDYRISSIGDALKGVGWSENELVVSTLLP